MDQKRWFYWFGHFESWINQLTHILFLFLFHLTSQRTVFLSYDDVIASQNISYRKVKWFLDGMHKIWSDTNDRF